jgi:photosystem II stability/assembly factor-like uncharacterized protein
MDNNQTHPYTLEISETRPGVFNWSIRERGKLLQRSDRYEPSEEAARKRAEKALESLFAMANRGGRR